MTALTQISQSYFVEREGASITLNPESIAFNIPSVTRDRQPFSVIGQGKLRKLFNRHNYIRMYCLFAID